MERQGGEGWSGREREERKREREMERLIYAQMYTPLQDAATVARSEAVSPGFGPSHSQHNEAEEGTLLSISFMSGGSNHHSQLAHGELNETLCSEVITCRLLPKLLMYIPTCN